MLRRKLGESQLECLGYFEKALQRVSEFFIVVIGYSEPQKKTTA